MCSHQHLQLKFNTIGFILVFSLSIHLILFLNREKLALMIFFSCCFHLPSSLPCPVLHHYLLANHSLHHPQADAYHGWSHLMASRQSFKHGGGRRTLCFLFFKLKHFAKIYKKFTVLTIFKYIVQWH